MATPTFDGENLIITLPSGVYQIDVVADIYGEWKTWYLASPANRKYPKALGVLGGDPLSAIINAGTYIFLENDTGWRIKPAEENGTWFFNGNLAPRDSTRDVFVKTIGTYNTQVIGLQPITQGVTPEMAHQLEYGSYQNAIWIDVLNGLSLGQYTTLGVANPGSRQYPLNNETDAVSEAEHRGFSDLQVIGSYTFMGNVSGYTIYGQNAIKSTITFNDAASAFSCELFEMHVMGVLDGGSVARESLITDLNYINGFIDHCVISPGTITLGGDSSSVAHFLNCYSGQPGTGTPNIDMAGDGPALALRGYTGGMRLFNKTGSSAVSIDLSSGQIILADTVTSGTIVVRGDGKVMDDSGNHILSGTWNGGVTIVNETTSVPHDHTLTAITDSVWADSRALTVPKFIGLS